MSNKKKKQPAKKRGRSKKQPLPKIAPDKFTVDDMSPTPIAILSLRSLNAAQRQSIAEVCEVIGYANYDEKTRMVAYQIRNFFLKYSRTERNTIPYEEVNQPKKSTKPIPRSDHA